MPPDAQLGPACALTLSVIDCRMIQWFRCKDTRARFEGGSPKRFRSILRVAERKLAQLNAALTLEFLRAPPGNHLEKLKSIPRPCRTPAFAKKPTCRTARPGVQCVGLQDGREADRASSMLEPPLGGGSGERHVQRMPGQLRRGRLLCTHSNALLSRAVRESRFRYAQVDDLPILFLSRHKTFRIVKTRSTGRSTANARCRHGCGMPMGTALRGAWELFEEGREADRASSMLEPPLGGGAGERHVQRLPEPHRSGLLLCLNLEEHACFIWMQAGPAQVGIVGYH